MHFQTNLVLLFSVAFKIDEISNIWTFYKQACHPITNEDAIAKFVEELVLTKEPLPFFLSELLNFAFCYMLYMWGYGNIKNIEEL